MNESELDKPIGTKEQMKLSAGSVVVKDITIEPPKEGSKAKLVVFLCQHPDREEPIRLSNIKVKKVQGNNENIRIDTLWWNLDDEGNIRKGSAVAWMLEFYKKKTLKDFKMSSIQTEVNPSGYLSIKAY